jgi:hypothetical protein
VSVLSPDNNPHWQALADEHRRWLSSFDQQHWANWEKLLKTDSEAALCEAAVRRLLQSYGVTVEPNEELTGAQRPDFRCSIGDLVFYVEVTCISINMAEKKSGIKDDQSRFAPFNVMGMTEAVFAECVNRAPQCASLDGPCLLALGTFHAMAAILGFTKVLVGCVLTGKTKLAWKMNITTAEQNGDTYQTTEFQAAAFLKPDKTQEVGFARGSISGILLCGLGTVPGQCLGVLHPNPAREFDDLLLPSIEFGKVELDRAARALSVQWPTGTGTHRSATGLWQPPSMQCVAPTLPLHGLDSGVQCSSA